MQLTTLKTAVAAVLTLLTVSTAQAVASPRVTQFPIRADFTSLTDIVPGPDGALYVPDRGLGRVWRVTTAGKIRPIEVGGQPAGAASLGGALWVTDAEGDRIVRLGMDGSQKAFPLPRANVRAAGIVAGPDGALWFAEVTGDAIGRMTADGQVTEYPITPGAFAAQLTVGPDGAVWFSEQSANKVGKVTMAGEVTEYELATPDSLPGPLASADGAIYFATRNANTIVRMTTAGVVTGTYAIPTENANTLGLVAAPDGALYLTEADGVRPMTLDGQFGRRYRVPGAYLVDSLAAGPDGALWFLRSSDAIVGRIDIGYEPPVVATGVTFTMRAGRDAEGTVATFTGGARNYEATIKWGDRTTSAGWVRRTADGSFEVRGEHRYAKPGTYDVTVKIADDAKVTSQAVVTR